MKKLRLDLHQLEVESFDLPDARSSGGTVRGQEASFGTEPCDYSRYYECVDSYDAPCWWTGDPVQDCYPASMLNPCTDHPAYC